MKAYKQGAEQSGLVPAGFLRAAGAKFIGAESQDIFRVDHGALDGPYAVGVWGASKGRFELTYGAAEFATLLEGRIRVSQAGEVAELGPGDSFFVPKGETVHWEVLEDVKKVFVLVP